MIRQLLRRRRDRKLTRLATVLAADPDARHFGCPLIKAARLRAGVGYVLLGSMERDGWVKADWQDPVDERQRYPRRFYTLTDLGRVRCCALLAEAAATPTPPSTASLS